MCGGAHSPPHRQANGHGWTGAASAPFARHRPLVLCRRSVQLPRPTRAQCTLCVLVAARVLQVGRACALRVELAVVAHVQACMPFLLSAPPSLVRRSPHEHAWFSKLGARLLRGSRAARAPKASQERTAYRRTASGAMLALTPTLPLPVHTARDPFPNLPFRHVRPRGRPSPRHGGRRRAALPSRCGPRAPLSACAAVACGGLSGPTPFQPQAPALALALALALMLGLALALALALALTPTLAVTPALALALALASSLILTLPKPKLSLSLSLSLTIPRPGATCSSR